VAVCYTTRVMADERPKTAYEVALERFPQKGKDESRPLTDAQKAAIGEARQVHQARVAEREILHQAALRKAGSPEEIEQLHEAFRRDMDRLATDRDRKIAQIRGEQPPQAE
jgi:hypothetical protein